MATTAKMSVVKEVGIFSVFMSVVISLVAYFILTGLKNAPALGGLPRALVLGVPLAIVAGLFAAAGILVLATRRRGFVLMAMFAGLALASLYLIQGATHPAMLKTPIAFVVYAIPVVLVVRGRAALSELKSDLQQRPTGT